ncbi:DUF4390 domain-containing protein [Neisseria chenwenguii]|uniref:Uncharacterized protein n=1 Tax=Neisseria chenwenguii TaxID=1853278 RepID=A0A220S172_9NEIS|nr:DUF4390 domain-containing protein [Neisseria chenwenguii]ASK27214.1 hypothetical protein BG910_05195 [Neisseria chenwenguii]ROV54841.1 DUF4390 domain-containing protein [Neisseria chenwenguii]
MAFITRLFRSYKLLLLPILLAVSFNAAAEGIAATRANAAITGAGQLSVSSRFKTDLPEQLKQALRQGVTLNFVLNWQLSEPTVAAYKARLSQLIGDDGSIQYKLTFHPLTNRYRVTVGTFSTEYDTLENALRAVGAVVGWRVLAKGDLNGVSAKDTKAEIRLRLSAEKLPKPFQINSLNSKNWNLDSGWKSLTITQE